MGFQDEAAQLFETLATRVGQASAQEAAGVDRLLTAFLAEENDTKLNASMRAAGEKLAAIGRELLTDLGHPDLVDDPSAVIFASMAALSSQMGAPPDAKA